MELSRTISRAFMYCLLSGVFLTSVEGENIFFEEAAKVTASDAGRGDGLGHSISSSLSTIVVGAPFKDRAEGANSGSAYVFEANQEGEWDEVKALVASNIDTNFKFGTSVSIDQDIIIVGADIVDALGGPARGAAYIYSRHHGNIDNWGEVKILSVPESNAFAFGEFVSVSGSTALVAAPDQDGGRVYLYERNEGGENNWGIVTVVKSPTPGFGQSPSISGDLLAVADRNGINIYQRDQGGADNWGSVAQLVPSDGARIGSLSLKENLLIAGASSFDNNIGVAYVFRQMGQGEHSWVEVNRHLGVASSARFGTAVAIDDNKAAVSAIQTHERVSVLGEYVDGELWGKAQLIEGSDGPTSNVFGSSVAMSNNLIAVGARWDDSAALDAGAVYIFEGREAATSRCDRGITYDDGLAEGGFGQLSSGGFVQAFTVPPLGAVLTHVCISWSRTGEDVDIPYEIVIYDDDGPNGGPGTLVGSMSSSATDVPDSFDPAVFTSTSINGRLPILSEGTYFIGALWDGASEEHFFINYDSSESTTYVASFSSEDGGASWTQLNEGMLQAFLIRADFAEVAGAIVPPEQTTCSTRSGEPPDPSRPTIVLTHGLQSDNSDLSDLWTGFGDKQAGALIEEALSPYQVSANILQCVWDGAFQPLLGGIPTRDDYVEAQSNVASAALAISRILKEQLTESYQESVHFIGHSLGVAVSADAAALFLNDRPAVSQVQFTALDRPDNILFTIPGIFSREDEETYGYGSEFLLRKLLQHTRPIDELRVDNYYSTTGVGVGDVARGAYNHPALSDPGRLGRVIFSNLLGNDHSGVHQWYRWSIDPVPSPSQPSLAPCDGQLFNPLYTTVLLIHPSLSPCEVGWHWSLLSQEGFDQFPNSEPVRLPETEVTSISAESFQGFGCQVTTSSLICAEGTGEQNLQGVKTIAAGAQIELPIGTESITFEYRFLASGIGDYVGVFLDGVTLWKASADTVGPSNEFATTIPISVGGRPGSRLLSLGFYGSGENDTVFEIRNIELISKVFLFADGFESGNSERWTTTIP